MKVLVSCYACSPYKGSEPGMGWNFVNALSKRHELHIITEEKFEKELERYFQEHPECSSDFHFYYIKRKRLKTLRKIWPPSYYWTYKLWQKKVYVEALKLDEKEHFDIVHQLNMVTYREPGYLWRMNIPFVWGPIGGFDISPWCMLTSMGMMGCLHYFCRNIINGWQMHHSKRVKEAMGKADYLISATRTQQYKIKQLFGKDSVIISEVGLETEVNNIISSRISGENLKICWSGQHTPGKSLNLLLEALALIKRQDVELHVLGRGSQTKKWMKQSKKLGIGNIIWYGWVERKNALEIMQGCHLFCITSLSDLTSTVLLEALSCGLPVIALDHCGFSNVINDSCGKKIAIHSKEQVVKELSAAISDMANNESLRIQLANGARQRALDFNWEDKAKTISRIYETLSV